MTERLPQVTPNYEILPNKSVLHEELIKVKNQLVKFDYLPNVLLVVRKI
jgi:hypothetical protein